MKIRPIVYWISTVLVTLMMAFVGIQYLIHAPSMMAAFTHLGYPTYFPNILGVAKLLGVCVLLAPRLPIIKEWAYAGFAITFISAFVSHLASGDGKETIAPIVALILLSVSYITRPVDRRVLSKENV